MSEAPGPKALRDFIEGLRNDAEVDADVFRLVARLFDEGILNAGALVEGLRELRSHGTATKD